MEIIIMVVVGYADRHNPYSLSADSGGGSITTGFFFII